MAHKQLLLEAFEVAHASQRYETVGDYITGPDGAVEFRISSMPDWRYVWLVMVHEIVEQGLCRAAGVCEADIDAFDMQFEADRTDGAHTEHDEPGDDPQAPYRRQHLMATAIEKMLCATIGINWHDYERAVDQL